MSTLTLKINKKITNQSKEFASIFDARKTYNIYEIAKICLNIPNASWGGGSREMRKQIHR